MTSVATSPPAGRADTHGAAPRVEVLLVNWNGWRDTIECLESVFRLDYPNYGVVVCDNASSDDSVERIMSWAEAEGLAGATVITRLQAESGAAEVVESPLIVIRTGGNLGFAGGNNVGLRFLAGQGSARYVWLLNNDTVVDPSALRHLVDTAAVTPRVGAVGATLLEYHEPETVQDAAGANFSAWHGMVRRIGHGTPASAPRAAPERLDFVSGGCMLVPMGVLAEVGLLDERFFMYGEDADWCTRMRGAGFVMAHALAADVWHKGGGSSQPGSATHDYHNVKASLLLIDRHHPARLPVAFAYSVLRCVLPKVARFEFGRLEAVYRAYSDFLRERRVRLDATTEHAPRISGSWRADVA